MCSLLYNRVVYSKEIFGRVKKYGLPLLLFQGEGVKLYSSLNQINIVWSRTASLLRQRLQGLCGLGVDILCYS
ncbi:putative HORMA domain superfamily protein [Helianthus annuus]|nr:putative HORMA domain superfamily protein [Helianthus annuus]KAJ0586238.1 putative HORMA domain superfamily protein [Helianthus annuus]KAJ0748724.1 putative HORMA domain superfamily protein [Helianthus annuus]